VATTTQIKTSGNYSTGSDETQPSVTITLDDDGYVFAKHGDKNDTEPGIVKILADDLLKGCWFNPERFELKDDGKTLLVFYPALHTGRAKGQRTLTMLMDMHMEAIASARLRMISLLNEAAQA